MQISATPRMERLIENLTSTGRYKNQTELLESALEALAARDSFDLIRAELDQAGEKFSTPEFTAIEDQAIEDLAERIAAFDKPSHPK